MSEPSDQDRQPPYGEPLGTPQSGGSSAWPPPQDAGAAQGWQPGGYEQAPHPYGQQYGPPYGQPQGYAGYGQPPYAPQDSHQGYGQPGWGAYPTAPYGYPRPATGNGMGVAGFVVGLVGLLLCWFPFAGLVIAGVGVGLSAVGLKRGRERGSGTGLAIAGLVCGIVGAVVGLLVTIGVLVTMGTSGSTY